jgi:hypothetical protein
MGFCVIITFVARRHLRLNSNSLAIESLESPILRRLARQGRLALGSESVVGIMGVKFFKIRIGFCASVAHRAFRRDSKNSANLLPVLNL